MTRQPSGRFRLRRQETGLLGGAITIFLFTFVVYAATGTYGGNQSRDTFTATLASWALATHHSFDLRFAAITHTNWPAFWLVPGAHGTVVSNRFPGAVLLAAPLYALFGGGLSAVPGTLTAALAAAGACALLYKTLRRLQSPRVALVGTLLFAFATSNWSVSGRELWEHPGAELVIAAGMLAAFQRRYRLAGLAFGAAVLFRPHLGIGAAVVCLGVLWTERRWRPAVETAVFVVPGLIGYLAWNFAVYGHVTIVGGYSDGFRGSGGVGPLGFLVNVAGTLVSPERGVLVCSPVLIVCVFGLRQAWRDSPRLERTFVFAGLAYLASQLWLSRFSGGDGFVGYRVCLESLLWAAPFLVRAGVVGIKRIGKTLAWLAAAASIAFCSTAAFVQGEYNGGANPWKSWDPFLLAKQYGSVRVLFGTAIGLAAVFVAWYILEYRKVGVVLERPDSQGSSIGPEGERNLSWGISPEVEIARAVPVMPATLRLRAGGQALEAISSMEDGYIS